MPTLTIYLNEKNFLFLSGISKGKSSSLGKTIIEDWIAKEKNEEKNEKQGKKTIFEPSSLASQQV